MSSDRRRDDWREAVWQSDLPPRARLVALVYADHAADDGSQTWVKRERLQARTGIPRSTLIGDLAVLVDGGWLDESAPARQHYSARYRLAFPCGQPCQRSSPQTSDFSQRSSPQTSGSPRGPEADTRGPEAGPDPHPQREEIRSAREVGVVITDAVDHEPRTVAAFADRLRGSYGVPWSPDEVDVTLRRIRDASGCDEPAARQAVLRLAERPKSLRQVAQLARYVQKAIENDPQLPTLLDPRPKSARSPSVAGLKRAELERRPECAHGVHGGGELYASTGKPLCLECAGAVEATA